MLDAERTEEPIVTDGSAWRQPAGHGGQASTGGWIAPVAPVNAAPGRPVHPASPAYPPRPPGDQWPQHPQQPPRGPDFTRPQPAPNTWWSDALADPWRDPEAPVVVVKTPPNDPPALEKPIQAGQGGRVGLGLVLMVSIVTALLAGALGGTLGYVFASGGGGGQGGTQLGATAPLQQRPPGTLASLIDKVLPSVVTIEVRIGNGGSLGSGFVVSDDGYVITNNHVVQGATGNAIVRFADGVTTSASIVGSDPESDVSVLKIDKTGLPADKVKPIEFGDSDQVHVGDPVVAIGSPLRLYSTATYGIVSYIDRPIHNNEGGIDRYYAAIQTDASVNQGNSGGPLFDGAGKVIGINSIIGTPDSQSNSGNVGLAFSIPINQAKRNAQEIIESGKARRTVLGAEFDGQYRDAAGGAKVTSVVAGGPAAAAGLKAGDLVMAINQRPIEEAADATALVRKYAPGTIVQLDLVRGGSRQKVSVTLAADAK
jgi:putative serine protease PepD